MHTTDLPSRTDDLAPLLSRAATGLGMALVDMGARHWHLRREGKPGTLEVTHDPRGGRITISYRDNRIGDGWVVEAAQQLAAMLESTP